MNDKIKELVGKSAMQGAQQAAAGAHGHAIGVLAQALYQAGADAARLEARLEESEGRCRRMLDDAEQWEAEADRGNRVSGELRERLRKIQSAAAEAKAITGPGDIVSDLRMAISEISKLAHDKTDEQIPF